MSGKNGCSGHCKNCYLLGQCPDDIQVCHECEKEIADGEGMETETDIVKSGRHYRKAVVVCRECYETIYQNDYIDDF